LAAARVKGLTVGQIAARLDDRFRLLIGGSRTALPRQQTLRATMDWSYDLLSVPERALLRRLSVFAGGFSLEAAEEVGAGGVTESPRVLDMLLQLVDKSLIVTDDRGDEARYRLLETVRQYGRDRLLEAGEAAEVQRRHGDWYLGLAERADARLRGPEQASWLSRLELDHDNFRAALEWSRDDGSAEVGLRLAAALWWFFFVHGHWSEAGTWLETTLARAQEAPRHVVPKALHAATFFAFRRGDLKRATELGEQGLALCRELGARENSVWLLTWLGVVALRREQFDEAERLFEQGIVLSRELRDDWLLNLVLAQLGILARSTGARERAIALHSQCLSLARETGDPLMIAYQLRNLGVDSLTNREYDRAAGYYLESLRLCREIGERWISEGCIEGLAAVAGVRGDYRRAARLFGAGETLRALTGDSRFVVVDNSYHQHLAATRSALGEKDFSAVWAAGQAMTLDEAIEYALASADVSAAKDSTEKRDAARGGPSTEHPGPLTAREREVAVLVAQGVSNREIATRLFISERTAQTHVQHILDKLGFTSRTQIATWTVQHGLLPPTG
jgi:DNA-binding CsgD family transcriptional regulator/tetratricopeptide (TPR) repeat protein